MAEADTGTEISVRLQLFADLRRFLPPGESGPLVLRVTPGTTVAELLREAGIPPGEEITIGLNGEQGSPESSLREGDEVVLFSPMEGG